MNADEAARGYEARLISRAIQAAIEWQGRGERRLTRLARDHNTERELVKAAARMMGMVR